MNFNIRTRAVVVTIGAAVFAVTLDGSNQKPAVRPSSPAAARPARPVIINRTVPRVSAPPLRPVFSDPATEGELRQARVFFEPLLPLGASSAAENQALAAAVTSYANAAKPLEVQPFMDFLSQQPSSAWRASVQANLGGLHRSAGFYSRALRAWDEAWTLSKDDPSPQGRAIADFTAGQALDMLGTLGQVAGLDLWLERTKTRSMTGPAAMKAETAREVRALIARHPERVIPSGPKALEMLLLWRTAGARTPPRDAPAPVPAVLKDYRPTAGGVSLAELRTMATKAGLSMKAVRRDSGAPLVVPAVVHLGFDHFSAVLEAVGGRYRVRDPALGGEVWMTREALDEEMTGTALIADSEEAPGWHELTEAEAAVVIGHSCPPGLPDPDECPCPESEPGMPTYSLHPVQASVLLSDAPLGYTPPRGPSVNLQLRYNHREQNQPQTFTFANLGAKWTLNWASYLEEVPFTWFDEGGTLAFAQPAHIAVHVPQGGVERFQFEGVGGVFERHYRSAAVLVHVSDSPLTYERRHTDGSKEVYAVPGGGIPGTRRVFLSAIVDPHGQALQFTWDGQLRLVALSDALGQVTTLQYVDPDPLKITSVTDPFGRMARLTYDGVGHLASVTDVINLPSSFMYGDADFITALQTPYGLTAFRKPILTGENARAIEAIDPLGAVERLEFWWMGAPVPATVPAAEVPPGFESANSQLDTITSLHWGKGRNVTNVQEAVAWRWLVRSMDWVWDPGWSVGTPHSVQRPGEARTWYAYTGSTARPSRVARKLPDGSVYEVNSTYNYQDNLTWRKDPIGRERTYTYAPNGIDLLDIRNTTSGRNDLLITYTGYTPGHQPGIITDEGGQQTTVTYNPTGQPLTVTNAKQELTTYEYEPDGRLQTIRRPMTGATVTYSYDAYGRVRSVTPAGEAPVTADYDDLNRPTRNTYADGTYEETTYDRLDLASERDRLGRLTRLTYNARRQVIATRDSAGRVLQQQWCACGALEAQIDGNGNATRWERDPGGHLLREVRADGTTVSLYSYDALGRVRTKTDPNQQVTTYTYNRDGSIASIAYSGGAVPTPGATWTYDPAYSRVTAKVDATGTTNYTYHPSGQLGGGRVATIDGSLTDDVISYTYDELGRLRTKAIHGVTTTTTYDLLGRIERELNALGTFVYSFDGVSDRIASVTYPNNQTSVYTYLAAEEDHRLQTINHRNPGGAIVARFDYTSDLAGNILTVRQQLDTTAVMWEYGYDRADQLIRAVKRATDPQGTVLQRFGYGYDAAGNRIFEQVDDSVTSSTYDRLNRLSVQQAGGMLRVEGTINEPATVRVQGQPATVDASGLFAGAVPVAPGTTRFTVTATDASGNTAVQTYDVDQTAASTSFTYDANGNMKSDGARQYTWNARNNLVEAKQGGNVIASFAYNSDGLRTGKTAGGITTTYLLDGDSVVEERVSTGGVTLHVLGPGADNVLGSQDAGGVSYYLRDHLGSVRRVTDAAGNALSDRDYDPWGVPGAGASAAGQSYTGRDWEPDLGLYYYRARYYNPRIGRFIGEDPAGGDGAGNLYAYVDNQPTNAIDPSGLTTVQVCSRPLQKKTKILGKPINFSKIFNHTYVRVTYDSGKEETYGILGDPGNSEHQRVRTGDQGGEGGTDRNSNNGRHTNCRDVPGTPCQIEKLIAGMKQAVNDGTCPSCGDNYDRWKPIMDGFNSNTWTYNMLAGAGMTPPPMPRSPGYHSSPGAWYP